MVLQQQNSNRGNFLMTTCVTCVPESLPWLDTWSGITFSQEKDKGKWYDFKRN